MNGRIVRPINSGLALSTRISHCDCGELLPWFMVLAVAGTTLGYPNDHGPFDDREKPKRFPLRECALIESGNKERWDLYYVFEAAEATGRGPRVRIDRSSDGWSLRVLDAVGRAAAEPRLVTECTSAIVHTYSADLNGDRKTDFALWFWYSGCGLAAEDWDVVFVLSSEGGYQTTTVHTMSPSLDDYLQLVKGKCHVVETSFVEGEVGKDGKQHNYWVHHLLEFDGATVKVSQGDPRFPKWVMYTFRPNHKETSQLTPQQKRDLWQDVVQQQRKHTSQSSSRFQTEDGIILRLKPQAGATRPVIEAQTTKPG